MLSIQQTYVFFSQRTQQKDTKKQPDTLIINVRHHKIGLSHIIFFPILCSPFKQSRDSNKVTSNQKQSILENKLSLSHTQRNLHGVVMGDRPKKCTQNVLVLSCLVCYSCNLHNLQKQTILKPLCSHK